MREIKFRAWINKDNTKMFYQNDSYLQSFLQRCVRLSNYNAPSDHEKYGDYVLMQYTGVKDKNGKEIYEGDIVSEESYNNGIVQFCEVDITRDDYSLYERAVCWNIKYPDGSTIPLVKNGDKTYSLAGIDCSIIGNIYENPELFEEWK